MPTTPKKAPQTNAWLLVTFPWGSGLRSVRDIWISIFSSTTWLKTAADIAASEIPAEATTIRKKFGISIDKNSVHGSDSVENAKIEIDFFFKN